MKAILEFNLPDERAEFEMCSQAGAMHCVLWDMMEYLCRKYKHSDPPSEGAFKEYEEARQKLLDLLDERGIQL